MSNPLQDKLKQGIMEHARTYNIEELKKQENSNDTVTLYHGTSSYYLNSILQNGILPRDKTGNNNWEAEEALSNEGIVYLTNKFHHFYAYNATEKLLKDKYGDEWSSVPEAQWWLTGTLFPIYLECSIPKVYLTADEDIIYTKFVKDKMKNAIKKGSDLNIRISWEESLAHQGTVGVRGGIRKEWIKSFTILGDPSLYLTLMNEKSQYQKEFRKWIEGKGKGKLKLDDLKKMEQKHKYVGTVDVTRIPKGYMVSQLAYNPDIQSMTAILNTPAEYFQQPRQLEKF